MAELDPELLERVARWCAEAGRQASQAEIRAALAPLGWDELLLVKALLADPPPARPLGPSALADIARGAPADVAAERERAGAYRGELAPEAPSAEEPRAATRRKAAPRARPAAVVVRRARDRAPEPAPVAPSLPLLDELRLPTGRSGLERLVRKHGGRRAVIARELAAGYRRADGAPVGEADLASLLDLHGLLRAFERRERDELLHAVRAAGGVLALAAEQLGLDAAGVRAASDRLGIASEVERIRDERRADLRGRALLSERVHLLLDEPVRLEDLGLLDELEADLRARLPEHLRALRSVPGPLDAALAASLSLDHRAVEALATRLGLVLADPARREGAGGLRAPAARPRSPSGGVRDERPGSPASRPQRGPRRPGEPRSSRPSGPRREGAPGRSASAQRGPRSASAPPRGGGAAMGRPSGPSSGARPSGPPSGPRPSGPRSGARPSGPPSGPRPSGPRSGARPSGPPSGARPFGPRSSPRPSGPPSGPRPSGPRSGPRPSGPPSGPRPSGPRSGARPTGPRSGARPTGPRGGARPSGPRRPPRRS